MGSEAGNAMVLVPIGVLVMLLLAGLAIDTALLFRAQADLDRAAAGLANDAAATLDTASMFNGDAAVRVDQALLARLAARHATASSDLDPTCSARVLAGGPQPRVEATCRGRATTLFRGIAGRSDAVPITTTTSAVLVNRATP